MRFFDSHAHYNDNRFDGARDIIITEVLSGGVDYILNAATDIESGGECAALAERYPQFYTSAGIHPHEAGKIKDEAETLDRLRRQLENKKTVAIGEIGLDFYYDFCDRETQKKIFRLQLGLAAETGYPVIIHDREAHGPCLEAALNFPSVRGVFHSFSGSAESAEVLIKHGWYVSFSGAVTFKNARKLLDAVRAVPPERMLIETDCPYLAPHPMRGKLNRSDYLIYTASAIAEAIGMTAERVAEATSKNARRLFGIDM